MTRQVHAGKYNAREANKKMKKNDHPAAGQANQHVKVSSSGAPDKQENPMIDLCKELITDRKERAMNAQKNAEYDRAVKMSESTNKDVQDMGVQLLKKLMEGTGGDVSGSSSSSGSGSGSYGSVVEL